MPVFTIESKPTMLDIRTRFKRGREALLKARRKEMNTLARLHVTEIRRLAPKKTGEFSRGIDHDVFEKGESVGFSVSLPQPLGKWLRPPGTKPHPITAKVGGVLRFVARDGTLVYTKVVKRHPGYRPSSDFVQDAVDNMKPKRRLGLRRLVNVYIEQVVK